MLFFLNAYIRHWLTFFNGINVFNIIFVTAKTLRYVGRFFFILPPCRNAVARVLSFRDIARRERERARQITPIL